MDVEKIVDNSVQLLVEFLMQTSGVLILLAGAWIVSGLATRAVNKALERFEIDLTVGRFLSRLTRWLILLVAVLGCLGIYGVETTSFAAVLGAASVAIGLAFQGSLANFAAGLMLLVFRPFEVGDTIVAASRTGIVDAIGIFATTMDTFDNRRLIIPNSAIFGATIENISHHATRRVDVAVGTTYDFDLDETRDALMAAAASVPERLSEPAPSVVLLELGASSIDWSVRVWAEAEKFGAVKQATIRAVKRALDEAGIDMPYPHMAVEISREGGESQSTP